MQRCLSSRAVVVCCLILATTAQAQGPESPKPETLVAAHYGVGFHDGGLGLSTRDGSLATVLVDWWQPFARGDHAVTTRIFQGSFDQAGGQPANEQTRAYAEWNGRLRVRRWNDKTGVGSTELAIATEVQRASMWRGAEYYGLAVTRRSPRLFVRGSWFYRPAVEADAAYRFRVGWAIPIAFRRWNLRFDGAENISTTHWKTGDTFGIPALVVDIGEHLGRTPGTLWAGVEAMHRHGSQANLLGTQAVIRWTAR